MSFAGRRRLRVAGSATQPPGTDWGAPGIGGGGGEGVLPFFADNLEGGQVNPANGFTWSLGAIWSVSSDRGVNGGTHSLKGTYPADANIQGSGDVFFNLGRDCAELWIEWYVWVPDNYYHRDGASSDNNKWLILNRDTISTTQAWRGGLEFDRSGLGGGSTSRVIAAESSVVSTSVFTQWPGTGEPMLNLPDSLMTKGAWNQFRFHWKPSSAFGVLDGVIEVWVNGTLLGGGKYDGDYFAENTTTYPTPAVNLGYFMGSSNSGYDEDTTFYVAGFKFFDEAPEWATP